MYGTSQSKILQYESFLNETLRNDLRQLSSQREKCFEEISQYYQLKSIIESISTNEGSKNPLQTQVDLGCNFYAQAVVEDPTKIFVSVGFGFFVEFTHEEALNFIKKKVPVLEDRVKSISRSMANVKSHIRLVMEALRELQHLA